MKFHQFFLVAVLIVSPTMTQCQYAPAEQGINSGQNYISSPIDSVNTTNGNLTVRIPLISYKQRGTLPDFTLILRYNNKSWSRATSYGSPGGQYCVPPEGVSPCDYYLWSYSGYGMQVIRGNTLSGFNEEFPTPFGPTGPGQYAINGVIDESGAQHNFYSTQAAAPYNVRTMDGSGVMGVVVRSNSPVGKFLDRNGIVHNQTGVDLATDGFYDSWTDPAGNAVVPVVINSSVDHWIDSIGRQIPAPLGGNFSPYDFPVGCKTYSYPSANGGTEPYKFCYSQYTVNSAFNYSSVQDITLSASMLSSITLPDGTSYSFSYNSWGDLSRITLPRGGTISYQWKTLFVSMNTDNPIAERVIQSRTLNASDGTPDEVWSYDFEAGSNPAVYFPVTVTDPLGNQSTYSWGSEVHYQGPISAGHKLSTVSECLLGGSTSTVFSFAGLETPPISIKDPTLSCGATTTLSDGSTSKVSITFDTPVTAGDPFNQPNDGTASLPIGIPVSTTVTNYGSGSPGSTLKTTTTQYQWQANGNYLSANFMSLPHLTTVKDGSGAQVSQITYCYDESGPPQSTCGTPQSNSGLLTSVHSWLNTTGSSISRSTSYNSQGMPTQFTDANGNKTAIISYQCSGLFPQTIVSAYQSSTTTPETTTYGYDCNIGQITSILDPNSQVTTYAFNDPLGRITQAKAAVGTSAEAWTTYSYPSATEVNVAQDQNTKGDGLLHSSYSYNGFGQILHSTAPNGAITDTTYDLDGRTASVSNPYVTTSDATYGITSYLYDALGRKVDQCQQDNGGSNPQTCSPASSYQSWTYSGPTVTFKDEVGNQWQRTSDALGRLAKVVEPNGTSTSPSMETDYGYDALDNLISVTQWGGPGGTSGSQTRSFSYDSLSRLIQAYNPESGWTCYGTSSAAPNGSNCTANYDPNGNLLSKTDGRGFVVSYTYDALNRKTQESSTAPNTETHMFRLLQNMYRMRRRRLPL